MTDFVFSVICIECLWCAWFRLGAGGTVPPHRACNLKEKSANLERLYIPGIEVKELLFSSPKAYCSLTVIPL